MDGIERNKEVATNAQQNQTVWLRSVEDRFADALKRKGHELTIAEMEQIKEKYKKDGELLRQMQQDSEGFDDSDWDEDERPNLEKNMKFKDLNRQQNRSIALIKGNWQRTKPLYLDAIQSSSFDNLMNIQKMERQGNKNSPSSNKSMHKNKTL